MDTIVCSLDYQVAPILGRDLPEDPAGLFCSMLEVETCPESGLVNADEHEVFLG
ncbi:MAG: hypothetical protein JXA96_09915 [Sedimentisphaerales bacterium]|nr:hypothetical protein [Sedimentisphaerales bacterium]